MRPVVLCGPVEGAAWEVKEPQGRVDDGDVVVGKLDSGLDGDRPECSRRPEGGVVHLVLGGDGDHGVGSRFRRWRRCVRLRRRPEMPHAGTWSGVVEEREAWATMGSVRGGKEEKMEYGCG